MHVVGKALTEPRQLKRTCKLAISPSCQCRCVSHHRTSITRGRPMILSSKLHYAIALAYLRDAAKANLTLEEKRQLQRRAGASAVESRRRMPAVFDIDSTILRLFSDSAIRGSSRA